MLIAQFRNTYCFRMCLNVINCYTCFTLLLFFRRNSYFFFFSSNFESFENSVYMKFN